LEAEQKTTASASTNQLGKKKQSDKSVQPASKFFNPFGRVPLCLEQVQLHCVSTDK